MFHLAAFTANLTFAVADQPLSLANDQLLVANAAGQAVVPYDCQLLAAYALGANLTRAKIVAPSMRKITYPYITPNNQSATAPTLPGITIYDAGYRPTLVKNEAVTIQNSVAGAANEQEFGFLWLCPRWEDAPVGVLTTVRFTAAIVGAANQWNSGVMVPTEVLPFGRYSVCGMRAVGASIIAARLIPTDGGIRPGVIGSPTLALDDRSFGRVGRMGKFMEFEQTSTPNVELFLSAAGTTQEIYLDVTKIA
jgi:hypothetical protein